MKSLLASALTLVALFVNAGCSSNEADGVRIVVSLQDQQLALVRNGKIQKRYAISTSAKPPSEEFNSGGTPRGLHYVSEKIGDGARVGVVFESLLPTAEVLLAEQTGRSPPITTRILRLGGLEFANRFTTERLIYIHGSPIKRLLGQPASGGCIRVDQDQVGELFDSVTVGTRVLVFEGSLSEAILHWSSQDALIAALAQKAKAGDVDTMSRLCVGHYYGSGGLYKDIGAAVAYCRGAADEGNANSMAIRAEMLETGVGVPQDERLAQTYYERAANAGHVHAMYKAAGGMLSRGAIENRAKATKLLLSAASKGHLQAQRLLADIQLAQAFAQ